MPDIATLFPDQSRFDRLYTEEVELPWKQEPPTDRPWRASAALKNRWKKMIVEGLAIEKLVGAVGLSRSVGLSLEEAEVLDCYWQLPIPSTVCADMIVCLLVTGGTPPPCLWSSYFQSNYEAAQGNVPASWWLLLAWFLRHPYCGPMAREIVLSADHLQDTQWRTFVLWQASLNPLARPREQTENIWKQAATLFHPLEFKPRYPLMGDLPILGYILRWFHKDKVTALQPLHTGLLSITRRRIESSEIPLPAEATSDPPLEVLQRVSEAPEEIRELWRYYSPLLRWPWDEPVLPEADNPSYAMALGILGYPPFQLLLADAWDHDPDLNDLWKVHPAYGTC